MKISFEKHKCSVCQFDGVDVFILAEIPICFACIRHAASIVQQLEDEEDVVKIVQPEDDNRPPCPEGNSFGNFANSMICFTDCSLIKECRSQSKENV